MTDGSKQPEQGSRKETESEETERRLEEIFRCDFCKFTGIDTLYALLKHVLKKADGSPVGELGTKLASSIEGKEYLKECIDESGVSAVPLCSGVPNAARTMLTYLIQRLEREAAEDSWFESIGHTKNAFKKLFLQPQKVQPQKD